MKIIIFSNNLKEASFEICPQKRITPAWQICLPFRAKNNDFIYPHIFLLKTFFHHLLLVQEWGFVNNVVEDVFEQTEDNGFGILGRHVDKFIYLLITNSQYWLEQ